MPTQWIQVWSLAGVQGAITLCWVIYGAYLPKLLQQGLGIPEDAAKEMTATLLVVENALAILMEPLWGGLSDRLQRWVGTRMPLILVGTILSAGLFVVLPLMVVNGGNPQLLQTLLPVVTVVWSLAMTMFRSPVICMLSIFAMNTHLPQATSILTLVGGLAGSTRFFAQGAILGLGPLATFGIGSGVLLGAVFVLQKMTANFPINPAPNLRVWAWHRYIVPLSLLLGLGLIFGWGTRLMFGEVFPRLVKAELIPAVAGQFSFLTPELILGSLALLGAIFALVMGQMATIYPNHLLMIGSCGIIAVSLVVLMSTKALWLLCGLGLVMVSSYAAIANGGIALALGLLPHWGGLAIGTYFGGFGAANMSFGLLVPKPLQMMTSEQSLIIAALMFLVGGFAVAITQRITPPLPITEPLLSADPEAASQDD